MRITIKDEDRTVELFDPNTQNVDDALDLCLSALVALSYHPESVRGAVITEALVIEAEDQDNASLLR